ncbi:MAG TPA: vWA domain-containing protein [Polyangiaceae bacterium]|nr:vWA domain-containing protein [Polyangiaceae bacterium]
MTRLSHVAWTLALCGIGFVACGARTGLLPGELEVGSTVDAAAAADVGVGNDGSCMGAEIVLNLNAPNLYFVLDHSTSMNEMGKWANMRTVVSDLMAQIGPGARFGTAMFPPPPGSDECGPGVEVMSVRQGDTQGNTANAFLAATASMPNGGTPTAATLRALRPKLAALGPGTFVILATDGGPNCNDSLSCQVGSCTLNIDGATGCTQGGPRNCCATPPNPNGLGCLDGTATAEAAAELDTAGVQTFVMGIPGSAPYSTVLDEVAVAGGTARSTEPLYFRVDTPDTGALSVALAQIAMQTGAGCTFSLKSPAMHPDGAQVSVGGAGVAPGGQDGWSLAGSTLTLGGASCNGARNAGAAAVKLIDGCAR